MKKLDGKVQKLLARPTCEPQKAAAAPAVATRPPGDLGVAKP